MGAAPMHHASITVTDLDRSIEFYERVLCLRTTMRAPLDESTSRAYLHLPAGTTGEMAMLQASSHPVGALELLAFDDGPAPRTKPLRPGEPGVWMVAFEVVGETLTEARDRLASEGVALWSDITVAELDGYPPFAMLLFEDPDGTMLELLELPSPDAVHAFRQPT